MDYEIPITIASEILEDKQEEKQNRYNNIFKKLIINSIYGKLGSKKDEN